VRIARPIVRQNYFFVYGVYEAVCRHGRERITAELASAIGGRCRSQSPESWGRFPRPLGGWQRSWRESVPADRGAGAGSEGGDGEARGEHKRRGEHGVQMAGRGGGDA
jgi:hypothetical protein